MQKNIGEVTRLRARKVDMARGSKFRTDLTKKLTDPDFAAHFLAAAIAEGDEEFLSEALAKVVKAHGSTKVAEESGIARQALYKMLSGAGNPSFKNVSKLLEAVGLELTIKSRKRAS
jgi:probable addiction module antidote protein